MNKQTLQGISKRYIKLTTALTLGGVLLAGCSNFSSAVNSVGDTFSGTSTKTVTLTPETQQQTPQVTASKSELLSRMRLSSGPEQGTIRPAKIGGITHNVALRGGQGNTRRFVIQRRDLQPMWSVDSSKEIAVSATMEAFSSDTCGGSTLAITDASHESMTGVWIIEAQCGG